MTANNRSEELAKTLIEICRIESITGNEKSLCDLIEHQLQSDPALTIRRLGNSLIVSFKGSNGGKRIGLFGHLDTVPGIEFGDKVRRDGDKIIGLGSSDMKAGVAIMLCLLRDSQRIQYSVDPIFVFYDGEEGPYDANGLHPLFNELTDLKQIDLAFMLEPTNSELALGCMGGFNATVTFKGIRAHSARPWEGRNAIHDGAAFITEIAQFSPLDVHRDELLFREVISATIANGGIATNVVPPEFTVNINRRFGPGKSVEEAQNEFLDLVRGRATVKFGDSFPAGEVPLSNPLLKSFRSQFKLKEEPKQAYTDVALLGTHGVDAVNFGPGLTAQAHQTGEYAQISAMNHCYSILKSFLIKPA